MSDAARCRPLHRPRRARGRLLIVTPSSAFRARSWARGEVRWGPAGDFALAIEAMRANGLAVGETVTDSLDPLREEADLYLLRDWRYTEAELRALKGRFPLARTVLDLRIQPFEIHAAQRQGELEHFSHPQAPAAVSRDPRPSSSTLRLPDTVWTGSDASRRLLAETGVAGNVRSRPHVVPWLPGCRRPGPVRVPKPRVLYDRFRVLFIGGCLFRKGLLRLLAALRKADLPHCELALVTSSIRGGTAYDYDGRPLAGRAATIVREAFRDLAITLVPPALGPSELTVLYQRSHVYVCPSVSDNGPNTLVESTWLGTPSVASDMSGALEAVPRDFRRTWVAPKWWRGEDGADCEEKLASEITRCYEELFLRRRLWDYGTAMQRDFFRSAWLERLFDEYRRVLRPAASGEVSPP